MAKEHFDGEGSSTLKDEVIFCCYLSIKMTDDPREDDDKVEIW